MKDTRTEIVKKISRINYTGNKTADEWYYSPLLSNKKNSPNRVAIDLFADILYWYKETKIRNEEQQHKIVEKKNKFAKDRLQYNYKQVGKKFNYSKDQIGRAVSFLHNNFLIRRTLEDDVGKNGKIYRNTVYVEPCPDMLMLSLEVFSENQCKTIKDAYKTIHTSLSETPYIERKKAFIDILKNAKGIGKFPHTCRDKSLDVSGEIPTRIGNNPEPTVTTTNTSTILKKEGETPSSGETPLPSEVSSFPEENNSASKSTALKKKSAKEVIPKPYITVGFKTDETEIMDGFRFMGRSIKLLPQDVPEVIPKNKVELCAEEKTYYSFLIDLIYIITGTTWTKGKEQRNATMLTKIIHRDKTFTVSDVLNCLVWLYVKKKLYQRSLHVVKEKMPEFLELQAKGEIDYVIVDPTKSKFESVEERKHRIIMERDYGNITKTK